MPDAHSARRICGDGPENGGTEGIPWPCRRGRRPHGPIGPANRARVVARRRWAL